MFCRKQADIFKDSKQRRVMSNNSWTHLPISHTLGDWDVKFGQVLRDDLCADGEIQKMDAALRRAPAEPDSSRSADGPERQTPPTPAAFPQEPPTPFFPLVQNALPCLFCFFAFLK